MKKQGVKVTFKNSGIGDILNNLILGFVGLITLYPFLYILAISINPPLMNYVKKVFLWPYGIDFSTYLTVLQDKRVSLGLMNSVIYTIVGTLIGVFFTMLTAYPLSLEKFKKYSKVFMRMIIFTMLFSGGLIPTYLLLKNIGFINKIWAIVIPGAISPFYLILARTFIQQLPNELLDAATIDGASEARTFSSIILPLCKPIIACLTLYIAVGFWNSYFAPLIYFTDPKKYNLQVYLREIVIGAQMTEEQQMTRQSAGGGEIKLASETVKSCTLVISTIPILIMYPFLQKYFVKGIMVGAIKG